MNVKLFKGLNIANICMFGLCCIFFVLTRLNSIYFEEVSQWGLLLMFLFIVTAPLAVLGAVFLLCITHYTKCDKKIKIKSYITNAVIILVSLVLVLVLVFPLADVFIGRDVTIGHNGERPEDFLHSTWQCKSPSVSFVVKSEEDISGVDGKTPVDRLRMPGTCVDKGTKYNINIIFSHGKGLFDYENEIRFYRYDPTAADKESLFYPGVLLVGKCKFYRNKCVVTVDHENSQIFADVDKFTLYRAQ